MPQVVPHRIDEGFAPQPHRGRHGLPGVRVARKAYLSMSDHELLDTLHQLRDQSLTLSHLLLVVQSERSQHLVVPRPAGVDLLTQISKFSCEMVLDGGVAVLVLPQDLELASLVKLNDPVQLVDQALHLLLLEDTYTPQHRGVSDGGQAVIPDQLSVEEVVLSDGELLHLTLQTVTLLPQLRGAIARFASVSSHRAFSSAARCCGP